MADTGEIKRHLNRHRKRVLECESMKRELEYIEENYGGLQAVRYDAMPRGKGFIGDSKVERQAIRKFELEERIKRCEEDLNVKWQNEIEPLLPDLTPLESLVIRLRYYHAADWSRICKQMYGRKDDFESEYQGYMNRMYKMHGNALLALAARFRPR